MLAETPLCLCRKRNRFGKNCLADNDVTSETSTPSPRPTRARLGLRYRLLIGVGCVPGCVAGLLIVLRLCGLIIPFKIPTGAMTPAVSPGDHILMEGFTYVLRPPRRGDIVVFATKGIPGLPQDLSYVKRIAGEPGDQVRILDGQLFINGNLVTLSNRSGEIVYDLPPGSAASYVNTNVTVQPGSYFVLGDNSMNSLDSRFWGTVPRKNIKGRVGFCY